MWVDGWVGRREKRERREGREGRKRVREWASEGKKEGRQVVSTLIVKEGWRERGTKNLEGRWR